MLTTTVCAALSAAGLAVAFLTAWRRRFVPALRIAAFALLPVGLAMAGLITLGGKIAAAVGGWAADLVLKPTVWTGFGVLALAVVLFVVARVAGRRGAGAGSAGSGRPQRQGGQSDLPAVTGGSAAESGRSGKSGGSQAGGSEDFSDIEAILKKHGI